MKKEQRGKGPKSRQGIPHERDKGGWEQWITADDGKRHSRSGRTKQEVQDKIAALRAELKNPERQRAKQQARDLGPTLAELAGRVLAKCDPDGGTYRTYAPGLAHWRKLLGDDTRRLEITTTAVQAAVDELAEILEPSSIETYYAALRKAMGADHPALKGIELPEEDDDEKPSVIIPPDLAARLQVAAQRHPLGIAVGLGFGAGLRAGEAAALRWKDIDFTRGTLLINGSIKPIRGGWARGKTKNGKPRLVHVNLGLLDWLERHQRIQTDMAAQFKYPTPEYVLADPGTGQGVTRKAPVVVLRDLLAAVCTAEEYALFGKLRFHALRHTHISALFARGEYPADLAASAGHTVATLFEYYAHPVPGGGQRLAALTGELFPVFGSEATLQATHPDRMASGRDEDLRLCKERPNSSNPHEPAASAENPDRSPPDTRTEPHEPAPVSNPVSNPEVQQ